jgi:hypothetical protein
MSYENGRRTQTTPEFWSQQDADAGEHIRKIAQSVNGILMGQTNNHFTITLEAGVEPLTVPFSSAKTGASVLLFPQNADASALGGVYATASTDINGNGQVTVNHGSATGGEKFSLVVIG